jgi:hypothetical protein
VVEMVTSGVRQPRLHPPHPHRAHPQSTHARSPPRRAHRRARVREVSFRLGKVTTKEKGVAGGGRNERGVV